MHEDPIEHPLEQLLSRQSSCLKEFQANYPELYVITRAAGNFFLAMSGEAAQITNLDEAEACRVMLWQMIGKYQFDSLLMIVTGELDAAYTILRNATEFVRDVAVIRNDVSNARRWWKAKCTDKRDRLFQWDDSDANQRYVHQLYRMASNWGTHGHITGLSHAHKIGMAGRENNVEIWKTSTQGIEETLAVWLAGFFPMQFICLQPFARKYPERFRQLTEMLFTQAEFMGKAATRLREWAASG